MSSKYIGSIDQGTTGTRFVVFDEEATPVADAFTTHPRRTDPPNRVEFDPTEIWGSAIDATQRGLEAAGIHAGALGAIAIANQRQTTLLWDRTTGEPVTAAISWQDRRATDTVFDISPETADLIRERTGLIPDPYFAAPTLSWLLENGGGGDLRERANQEEVLFGTVDSWLVYNLTGSHVTDVTNAAQTMLLNIRDLEWDEELLDAFEIPREILPEVKPSSSPDGFGRTDPDGVLSAEVPVTGVIGDQQAVLLGQAGFDPGTTKVTYGSGNFFLQNTGQEAVIETDNLLTTVWFQQSGGDPWYGLEGPLFSTGVALEWLESAGLLDAARRTEVLNRRVDDPNGVFVVPSFSGFGAPFWPSEAQAAVLGLSQDTRPEHIIRATIESIAYGTRLIVETAGAATDFHIERLLVDGGAIYDDEYAQLQADLIGFSLDRAGVTQTTALGAAFAAGLAVGTWDSLSAIRSVHQTDRTFQPTRNREEIDQRYRNWLDIVELVGTSY